MAKISQIEGELKTFQELLEEVADDEEISSIRGLVQEFVNELSPELFFNIDVQRLINKFLWETRDALGFSCMADTFSAYSEGFVEEISFGKLNVKFFNSKYTFVLPDETENSVIAGNGNGFEEKEIVPRVRLMYEVLADLGIENVAVYDGITLSSQFRKVPYKLFIIEEVDRAVLICEESGNRTFVKAGLADLEKFSFSRKSELKERDDVRNIVWNGAENWKEKMEELLVIDFGEIEKVVREPIDNEDEEDEEGEEGDDGQEERGMYPKMDREYFTEENVRHDLEAYCKKAKLPDVSELCLGDKFKGVEIICSNGELVKFFTYVKRASKFLSNEKLSYGQTLDELKRIYGLNLEMRKIDDTEYPKMDREYFTKENVKHDLDAYCKESKIADISKLKLGPNVRGVEVVCSNGEVVKFDTYLDRASRTFGHGNFSNRLVLDELKRIYGIKIEKCSSMKKDYFTEENVRSDLGAYCRQARLGGIKDLKVSKFLRTVEVVCENGENLTFKAYLMRASRFLCDGNLTSAEALDELKRICGVNIEMRTKVLIQMDRAYFKKENVKRDLEAYCEEAGLNDVSELTTTNSGRGLEVVCSNGECVKFRTYLWRASKFLSNGVLSEKQVLYELKRICGDQQEILIIPMNGLYFTKENVKRDLMAYCDEIGVTIIEELNTGYAIKCRATCSNGEDVMLGTYLWRASKFLSDGKFSSKQALAKLKQIVSENS